MLMPTSRDRPSWFDAGPSSCNVLATGAMHPQSLPTRQSPIFPAHRSAHYFQTSVPLPSVTPFPSSPLGNRPRRKKIAGTSALRAPLIRAGVFLSQPPIITRHRSDGQRIVSSPRPASPTATPHLLSPNRAYQAALQAMIFASSRLQTVKREIFEYRRVT